MRPAPIDATFVRLVVPLILSCTGYEDDVLVPSAMLLPSPPDHAVPSALIICNDSALQRWRGVIDLVGTGAHADIAAIDQVSGTDQAHRHLRIRHRVGPTTSTQLFKSVLADHAIASFDGLVDIAKGADGANAEQLSRTLLLSPTARGDTRPQLDVHADEVKAAHGATVGQLDADELLYLRMRGLSPASAKGLLVDGFIQEVAARLPAAAQQAWLARSTP